MEQITFYTKSVTFHGYDHIICPLCLEYVRSTKNERPDFRHACLRTRIKKGLIRPMEDVT